MTTVAILEKLTVVQKMGCYPKRRLRLFIEKNISFHVGLKAEKARESNY